MSLAPNVENYSLGKGVVYFDRLDADGNATGELDLGNAPVFSVTPTQESLAHFESRSGIKEKDKEVDTTIGMSVKITLDEYSKENLNLALKGDAIETQTQADGTQINAVVVVFQDRWVELPHRKVDEESVGVTDQTGAIHYTRGTDYRVDETSGRIFVYSAGAIADGQTVLVDYNYNAYSVPTINPVTRSNVEGYLRFKGDPTVGPAYEVELWRVKLKCDSDINFITDDWATVELTGEVLKDVANHEDDPWGRVWALSEDALTES